MENSKQKEVYMKTYSGKKVNPLKPEAGDIELRDIAHALSLICRGNGQTTHFYSVGQHCLNCQREAKVRGYSVRVQLACLLHDASEAYLCDLIRPIKEQVTGYIWLEEQFLTVVYQRFHLCDLSLAEQSQVKDIDDALLCYDMTELLKEPLPVGGYTFCITPDVTERPFADVEAEYIQTASELINLLNES